MKRTRGLVNIVNCWKNATLKSKHRGPPISNPKIVPIHAIIVKYYFEFEYYLTQNHFRSMLWFFTFYVSLFQNMLILYFKIFRWPVSRPWFLHFAFQWARWEARKWPNICTFQVFTMMGNTFPDIFVIYHYSEPGLAAYLNCFRKFQTFLIDNFFNHYVMCFGALCKKEH